jgi:arylsulfatase A-like enzyme
MRQGVLLDGWKLILDGRDRELYDLRNDPNELENLAPGDAARVAALEAFIKAWDSTTEHGTAIEDQLNEDDLRALDALGYLE